MMKLIWLKRYLFALAVFLVLDLLWLGVIAQPFYQREVGALLAKTPNWGAASVFYVFYIVGLMSWAIVPGIANRSLRYAIERGAFYGLVTYATYDLTNLATLAGWSLVLSVVDILWGTTLCVVTTTIVAGWEMRKR